VTTLATAARAGRRREMRLLAATTLSALLKSRPVAAVRRSGGQIADLRTLIKVVGKEHVVAQEGVISSTTTLARGRRHAIAGRGSARGGGCRELGIDGLGKSRGSLEEKTDK
jgi:hypothetical protein